MKLTTRHLLRGKGQHRARRPVEETTSLHALLRPIEALDQVEARCPIEQRTTLHLRFAAGGLMCLDCRNPGPNNPPREEATHA